MSWHDLNVGVEYELEGIISILERRISTCELNNLDDKKECIGKIKNEKRGICYLKPKSSGWGLSPFNPNAWRTEEGRGSFFRR